MELIIIQKQFFYPFKILISSNDFDQNQNNFSSDFPFFYNVIMFWLTFYIII